MTAAARRRDRREPDGSPDPTPTPATAPGVITLYSDIICPWAHVATHRLRAALHRRGSEAIVDHRAFPLEVLDGRPTPRAAFDRAVSMGMAVEPDAGWAPWAESESTFPSSSLLALEAVQAAGTADPAHADRVDQALRTAFWSHHKCIAALPVVIEIIDAAGDVDTDETVEELWSGRPRAEIRRHVDAAATARVPASPTLIVQGPDGPRSWTNPGIATIGPPEAFDVQSDDPGVFDEIIDVAEISRSFAGA